MASSMVFAQADLTVGPEVELDNNGSYDFLIPANLDTLIYPQISFFTRGGDGGRGKRVDIFTNTKRKSGQGTQGVTELTPEMVAGWTDSEAITANIDVTSVDCNNIGSAMDVTVTLADECGNTDNCTRQIRIRDGSGPTIVCQDITRALDANGEALLSYGDLVASVTDNCDINNLTFELTQSIFTCSDLGVTRAFVSVEDEGGNRRTCSGFVTIVDQTPPFLTCKDATIELGEDGTYRLAVDDVVASFSDNCTGGFSYSNGNFTCEDVANSPISIDVRYRDVGNNTTVCNSVITILETANFHEDLIGDFGLSLLIGDDLSFPRLSRLGYPFDVGGFPSIRRVITVEEDFSPTFTNARFTYLDAELNGIEEEELGLYMEQNGVWEFVSVLNHNTTDNYFEFVLDFSQLTNPVRFTLTNAAALPLNLLMFIGSTEGKANLLEWTTANEEEFSHFEVARSADGVQWAYLGAVAGAGEVRGAGGGSSDASSQTQSGSSSDVSSPGSQTYLFKDGNPQVENYYRLKMVDFDGSFAYSPVVKLSNQSAAIALAVSPNPSDGHFRVALPGAEGPFDFALHTVQGTRVRAQKVLTGTLNWVPREKLPPGVYLLVATSEQGRWTKQIVIR